MADATQPPASAASASAGGQPLVISEDAAKRFPDVIELIRKSESMNAEERQYWINILPIMTPDQVQNLRDILDNEKKQLKAIDEKYTRETPAAVSSDPVKTEEEIRKKREQRQSAEAQHKREEDQETENILKQIEQK